MSHSLPYISAAFYLQKAVAIAPAVVRIRFTYVPKAANLGAVEDAISPSNYKVTGSRLVDVTSVSKVEDDPQSLDVFLNAPLSPGLWNITASNTIQAFDDNANLASPNSITFAAARIKTKGPINGGALSDSAADIIRKHLPPSFAGPAWDSLIEGLALGDAVNWQNAQAAFDQLFVSSASGNYLDRRASDGGIARPSAVGMSDDSFREYSIRTSAEKLTSHSILQILETFYGSNAVRARMETKNPEPYRIEDEDTLKVGVDGIAPIELVFRKRDFAQIGLATAVEVAASMNRQFRDLKYPAFAATKQDLATLKDKVVVYSASLGLGSSVTAFGGFADNSLQFPDLIDTSLATSYVIDITNPSPGIARFSLVDHPAPVFADIQAGDCLNVWGDGFHESNRGTFTVVDVAVEWNGSAWEQTLDVVNEAVEPQNGATIFDIDDFVLFRPVRNSPSNQSGVLVAQTSDGIDVVLPATTSVVSRDEFSGAHANGQAPLDVETISVQPSGVATVTTTQRHFLSVGDKVEISGLAAGTALPSAQGKTASLTSYAPLSATDTFSLPQELAVTGDAAVVAIDDSTAFVCGGSSVSAACLSFSEGVGIDAGHNGVAWSASAEMPVALSNHTATALTGSASGTVLVVGGLADSAASASAYLYSKEPDSWTTVEAVDLTARHSHTAVRLADSLGNDVVVVYGGKADDDSLAEGCFKYISGEFSAAAGMSGDTGRFDHAATAISKTSMLAAGGSDLSDVLSTSFVYDALSGTRQECGKLAIARKDFSLVTLPSGSVLAVGGLGKNLSNETATRAVHECELFDPAAKSWRPAGCLRHGRVSPVVALVGKHVYVMGGTDTQGSPVKTTEVYDTVSGEWRALSSLADLQPVATTLGAAVGSLVVAFSSAGASVLTPRKEGAAAACVRGTLTVASILGPNEFTVAVDPTGYLRSESGIVAPFAAPVAASAGPYMWNPDGDLAVTATEATLISPISADQQYSKLELGPEQALGFPDSPGWLCINHGTEQVIGPIPYLGRVSDSELMLDYGFKFPKSAPEGSVITLLSGKAAYVPARPEQVGSFYLTASSSGRVVAEAAIENVLAAGLGDKLRVTVLYPGDKGLGNAGYGTTGQKISDKVAVWGGNDLDSELAQAREEE